MEHHREAVEEQVLVANPANEVFRYRECTKNQAIAVGGYALDGCGEFMPSGPEGSIEALHCIACHCHRNYHRRETVPQNPPEPRFHQQRHHYQMAQPHYNYHHRPAGYLHITGSPSAAHHNRPFAQPSTSRNPNFENPSSSSGSKRFRTKFTQEQKARMLDYAVGLGWKIRKEQKSAIQDFCTEIGITRQVFKVWMHNNKHTLGHKP